ncbi:MAG: DUF6259 domain-containing protein [Armatimonadota bacterium]
MELANKKLSIVFNEKTGGIAGINDIRGNHSFIRNTADKPLIWRLVLKDQSGIETTVENIDLPAPEITSASDTATITWKFDVLDVTVTCKLNEDADIALLGLNVVNHSDKFGLWNVVFPVISSLSESGKSDAAIGRGNWGQLYRNAAETITGEYPSYTMPMQFMLVNEGSSGLYLAAHDPGAMTKNFNYNPGVEFHVNTLPEDMGVPGSGWKSPYPFTIGVYHGDWMTGCKMYRSWAVSSAPWARKGLIKDRKDVPVAMRNIAAWIIGRHGQEEAASTGIRFAEAVGASVGVHWYEWHKINFDRDYPSYFPAKPGMAEGTAKMKSHGIQVMPYINCRLWDIQEKDYNTAVPYTCKDELGNTVIEDYGSGTTFGVMCPTQKFWREKLMEIVKRLVEEVGVNTIYLDQISSAAPRQCFDESHGHPVGSGTWWVDGYREILNEIKDYCTSNGKCVGLTSENNAEPYMDNIDSFLIWTPREENEIPMITAVYSGYALYFASNRAFTYGFYNGKASDYGEESFCMLQAREAVWGSQLGWEDKDILEEEHAAKLEFQVKLARMRSAHTEYLSDGELIKVLQPINDIPVLSGKWNTWSGDKPVKIAALHGALWQAPDGSLAAIMANADTKSHAFAFKLDMGAKSEIISGPSVEYADDLYTVEVPARDAVVIKYGVR